ncbi:MAG: DUF695 domain-containing protein [Bacteroidota bacterium]
MPKLKHMCVFLMLRFVGLGLVFGQETQWLKKNLGTGEDVYQFSVKDGLSPNQLHQQYPIRFEIEWTYSQLEHLDQVSSVELKQIQTFEEELQKALNAGQIGIWVAGFFSLKSQRWILYVKGEEVAYKMMAELDKFLPEAKYLEIFEEEDLDWKEYKQLKELILDP